jgi:hypothetical protein
VNIADTTINSTMTRARTERHGWDTAMRATTGAGALRSGGCAATRRLDEQFGPEYPAAASRLRAAA